MHFSRYLTYWTKRLGEQPMLVCGDASLSWAGMEAASAAMADTLRGLGVGPGDRFACLLPNCLEWTVALVAAVRLGAVLVPLNTLYGRFELEQIYRDADCAALFSKPSEVAKIGWKGDPGTGDEPLIYDCRGDRAPQSYRAVTARRVAFADHQGNDDDIMMVCYTSGTTGVPKGVTLTHRSVDAMCRAMQLSFDWRPGDERVLILPPLAFTGTIICSVVPVLVLGGCGFIVPPIDPAAVLKVMCRERITHFAGVPAVLEPLTRLPGFAAADLADLRTCYTGGAPVPRPLLDAYLAKGVVIRQVYGTSESSASVTCPTPELATMHPESCGHPFPTIDIEIRDGDGRRIDDGEIGEIYMRGTQMMEGYWRKPEANADAFVDGWYRTGDLGRYDPVLGLFISDRRKNMLISGGVNIYPAEIERAIATLPGIIEVAVFGVPNPRWGDEVVALLHAPTLTDTVRLLGEMRELLGKFKTPRRILLSPEPLPRTATNKIQRKGLDLLFARLEAPVTAS